MSTYISLSFLLDNDTASHSCDVGQICKRIASLGDLAICEERDFEAMFIEDSIKEIHWQRLFTALLRPGPTITR